jgi:hypothetical protein
VTTGGNKMMYPFIKLEDDTEIVHSEMLPGGKVKVYIEKPVIGGFHCATCYLPAYEWSDITGFSDSDVQQFLEIIESTSHLIIRFSKDGGFENAASF